MRRFILIVAALSLLAAGMLLATTTAQASETTTCTTVVDSEAIAAQHYSYTGGPVEGAPSTTPPGDDWQANTTQEPHLNNPNVTWVDGFGVGLHYTSAGNSGKADYFYFQPAVAAVTHEECVTTTTPDETVPTDTTPDDECTEDMPCWDCETMGNKECGPVDTPDSPPVKAPPVVTPDAPAAPGTPVVADTL